jgi:plastocyanin
MTLRWVIFFSLGSLTLKSATVTGKVELRDSRVAAVRKRFDFSGVVVALVPSTPFEPVSTHATMLQKNKMFVPHVLAVAAGTYVDFPNSDPIFHNAFSSYNGQIFDVGLYAPGSSKSVRFSREGIVRVFCNIHSSMSAVIAVLPTTYFATSTRDGSYQIANVPPGEYRLTVFHERATEAALRALAKRVIVERGPLNLAVIAISEAGFLQMPHTDKYGHAYGPETDDKSMYPAATKK